MTKHLMIIVLSLMLVIQAGIAQQFDEEQAVPAHEDNIEDALSPEVADHILNIFEEGQDFGNREHIFSKIGDSLTVSRRFLYPFGVGDYDTGDYAHLETIIDTYSEKNARIGNSFINESLAAGEGWSANAVLNPHYANDGYCQPDESPLFCEYRLLRPSIALIMFGTNDTGYRTGNEFEADMQSIIHFTEGFGIIPVLSTIPNRPEFEHRVLLFNDIIRQLASEHDLPLIELYQETVTLADYGLTWDNVHLSSPPIGSSAIFNRINLQYGYVVRNLATLEMLYAIHTLISA